MPTNGATTVVFTHDGSPSVVPGFVDDTAAQLVYTEPAAASAGMVARASIVMEPPDVSEAIDIRQAVAPAGRVIVVDGVETPRVE